MTVQDASYMLVQIFEHLFDWPRRIDDLKTVDLDHFVKLGEEPALIAHEAFIQVLTHVQVHPRFPVIETAAVQDSRYEIIHR